MPDTTELVKIIKKAAIEAMEATKPVNVCFGTVESVNPLKINVEQRLPLSEAQLVLTKNVTDFETEITWSAGKEKIKIHNGLVAGDEVILFRQQGGQKFIVFDRIGGVT